MLSVLFTLLAAVVAAILRGFQLARSFSPADELVPGGDPLTAALVVFSAVFIAAVILYTFAWMQKKRPAHLMGARSYDGGGYLWPVAEFLAAGALFASSVADAANGFSAFRVSLICLGVLGVLSAAALILTALPSIRGGGVPAAGFWMTLPVFWSCFLLFVDFRSYAGNPVRNAYVYGMLAMVCCTLALNAAAGLLFRKASPRRVSLFALPGVFFAALTLGGSLFARFVLRPERLPDAAFVPFGTVLKLLFVIIHLSALVVAVHQGRLKAPEPEKEPDGADDTDNTEDTEDDLPV